MKLIGVEGGGTKTVVCIATASTNGHFAILGRGCSGPSNIHAVGLDSTLANLSQAIAEAWSDASLTREPAAAACLIMAGVDRPQEENLFTQWAHSQKLGNLVKVTNDSVGLLAAGTREGWGIGVVAGTGSIAFGQTVDGRSARTGGWGYLMGDEGSAYTVTLAGLTAAVRSVDGRNEPTQLLPAFLERLNLSQPVELLEAVYLSNRDRAWIASLADVVTMVADAGDAAALEILDRAAVELAHLVATTARKLDLHRQPIPLCFTGGLLLNTPELQRRMVEKLTRQNIALADCVPVDAPVIGAIKLAAGLLKANA